MATAIRFAIGYMLATIVTRWIYRRWLASWAGARKRASNRGWQRQCDGISTTSSGLPPSPTVGRIKTGTRSTIVSVNEGSHSVTLSLSGDSSLKRIDTELPGVCIIEPEVFEDPRGCFFETYHQEKFAALGIDAVFVQENQSLTRKGVLRGMHYQLAFPQAKLCRVVAGEVFDVAVDIRVGSETFGRWLGVVLS